MPLATFSTLSGYIIYDNVISLCRAVYEWNEYNTPHSDIDIFISPVKADKLTNKSRQRNTRKTPAYLMTYRVGKKVRPDTLVNNSVKS